MARTVVRITDPPDPAGKLRALIEQFARAAAVAAQPPMHVRHAGYTGRIGRVGHTSRTIEISVLETPSVVSTGGRVVHAFTLAPGDCDRVIAALKARAS